MELSGARFRFAGAFISVAEVQSGRGAQQPPPVVYSREASWDRRGGEVGGSWGTTTHPLRCCPTHERQNQGPGALPGAIEDPPARKVNCSAASQLPPPFRHTGLNIESSFYQLLKSLLLPRERESASPRSPILLVTGAVWNSGPGLPVQGCFHFSSL